MTTWQEKGAGHRTLFTTFRTKTSCCLYRYVPNRVLPYFTRTCRVRMCSKKGIHTFPNLVLEYPLSCTFWCVSCSNTSYSTNQYFTILTWSECVRTGNTLKCSGQEVLQHLGWEPMVGYGLTLFIMCRAHCGWKAALSKGPWKWGLEGCNRKDCPQSLHSHKA